MAELRYWLLEKDMSLPIQMCLTNRIVIDKPVAVFYKSLPLIETTIHTVNKMCLLNAYHAADTSARHVPD
jgi:hypothetical protein